MYIRRELFFNYLPCLKYLPFFPGVENHKKENSVDSTRSRPKSFDATDNPPAEQYRDPPIPQREPYKEPERYQPPPHPPQQLQPERQKFDHRHARSYDGSQRPEPRIEANHRHTGSYDGSYYPEEPYYNSQPASQPSESDYDSDGNLMTPEEKSRRARQLQRQREYEERLAKWEADRLRKEEEEREQEQLAEQDAERAYEVNDGLTLFIRIYRNNNKLYFDS